jgi:acyl-coenzyme A thioesterase PaaI-like protein
VNAESYPPAHHALRDLPFEVEVVSATAQLAHLDPGPWSVGALATVADVLGGSLCAGVVAPDWMATSSLTLRLHPPSPGALEMHADVLRAGRSTVTIEVRIRTATEGEPVGVATLAFARLPRREDNLDLSGRSAEPGARVRFGAEGAADGAGSSRFDAELGQRVVDAGHGRTETVLAPYVRNSFGALNGGVAAALAAGAAAAAADAPLDAVDEVSVHHLGQGRIGPIGTVAAVALGGEHRSVLRVELRDLGAVADAGVADGRLVAVAHVGVGSGRSEV